LRNIVVTNQETSVRELQRRVDEWIHSIGIRYFSELTNLAQLMEELGEVARIMSRRYGDQSAKSDESPGDLADELADVLFTLVCIANQTGVDLESAIQKNLKKKTVRDAQRHQTNAKLTR
jgi:NTP pyrophosphatase (non-canonical NTP hydrolase)